LIVLAGFAMITARLFVWPQQGMPAHVDAIVMLDGPGDRVDAALKLAERRRRDPCPDEPAGLVP